jgi:hypothetical protein
MDPLFRARIPAMEKSKLMNINTAALSTKSFIPD